MSSEHPSLNKESKRRAKAWGEIMSVEGGLADLQDAVLGELTKELDNPKNFLKNFQEVTREGFKENGPTRYQSQRRFANEQLEIKENHYYYVKGLRSGHAVRCYTLTESITKEEEYLHKAMTFFSFKIMTAANSLKKKYVVQDEDLKKAYKQTDLVNPTSIIGDNAQTLLDVIRVATKDANSIKEQFEIIKNLTEVRPLIEHETKNGKICSINSQKNTVIELCARAPFGFWATTQDEIPLKLEGEDILDETNVFSDKFMRLITHGSFGDEETYSDLYRHGGCPALRPDVRNLDLINRLTETFLRMYKMLYKSGALD